MIDQLRDDRLSLKIGLVVQGVGIGTSDTDRTLRFDAEQESSDIWRIVRKADREPGENGFCMHAIGTRYEFTVAKWHLRFPHGAFVPRVTKMIANPIAW